MAAVRATPAEPRLEMPARRPVRVAAVPQIQRKLALVIGVDNYADDRIPKLDNAVNDATTVGQVFEKSLGYQTLVVRDGSKQAILAAFNQLAALVSPSDSVVIYYAGHGELVEKTGTQGIELVMWLAARGALGNGLRLHIGIGIRALDVGPVRFGKVMLGPAMTIGDRCDRRRHDEPLDAGFLCKAQCPKRPFPRRDDEFVLMLRRVGRDGRCDMRDMSAASHRLGPAIVAHQVGRKEFEPAVVDIEPGAHVSFAREIADAGVDLPIFGNELPDEEAGDVTAPARYENLTRHGALLVDMSQI